MNRDELRRRALRLPRRRLPNLSKSATSRAIDAITWGVPAVNFQLMLDAFVAAGGGASQVVYWSRPVNWKDQTLTPNPDTIYLTPFYDTSKADLGRAQDGFDRLKRIRFFSMAYGVGKKLASLSLL